MRILLAFLLCVALPAQVVRMINFGTQDWSGWKRTTVDTRPPHDAGTVQGATYVLGRPTGRDVWAVDVRCTIPAGQRLTLDLAASEPTTWQPAPLPDSPLRWFGGPVTLAGGPMALVGLELDGAAYVSHLRRRTGRMLTTDLWVRWYPDRPAIAYGETITTASNPAVPDMGETANGLHLRFGDAWVHQLGRGWGQPLVADGMRLADGQARASVLTFVWRRHLQPTDISSVMADTGAAIGAVGIAKLHRDGNPRYPSAFRPLEWANGMLPEAIRRMGDWRGPVFGPNTRSADTGAQADQVFVAGWPTLPDGAGTEWVAYLSALKMAHRPCHHLNPDGTQWDVRHHAGPRAVMWDGRFHWHTGVSPYQGGKPRDLGAEEVTYADGLVWLGPDVEHWLHNTTTAAARFTGSPAVQWLLEAQARLYFAQYTTTPGWSTSSPNAARAVGWEADMVLNLFDNLADRDLADAVRDHWHDRVRLVFVPQLGSKPGDIWDPRGAPPDRGDPRLELFDENGNALPGWLAWQQAVGAGGLDRTCAAIGPPEGRDLAYRAALAVLEHAFRKEPDGTWREFANLLYTHAGKDPSLPYEPIPEAKYEDGTAFGGTRQSAPYVGRWFFTAWHPRGIACVLRHDPNNEKARQIMDQMVAWASGSTHQGAFSWFEPGVWR